MATVFTITITMVDTASAPKLTDILAAKMVDPIMKAVRKLGEAEIVAGTATTITLDYSGADAATITIA